MTRKILLAVASSAHVLLCDSCVLDVEKHHDIPPATRVTASKADAVGLALDNSMLPYRTRILKLANGVDVSCSR